MTFSFLGVPFAKALDNESLQPKTSEDKSGRFLTTVGAFTVLRTK